MVSIRLQASGLGRRFGARWVFRQLDLNLAGGSVLVVSGANGSGKSTLLKVLSGLLPATEGSIDIDNVVLGSSSADVWPSADPKDPNTGIRPHPNPPPQAGEGVKESPQAREAVKESPQAGEGVSRNMIGLTSPELALYGALTGIENYRFLAKLRGQSTTVTQAEEAMDRAGLGGRGHDRVDTYSTGMKQRLRLALATQHQPPILLLDEPTAGMDDAGRKVLDGILDDQRRRGIALFATNDTNEYRYGDARLHLGV